MIPLDYILLGLIVILGLLGLKKGFLESLGSIVGIVIAALIASRFYLVAGHWLGGTNISNIIAFILIFGVAVKVVSLLFWVTGKIFRVVTVLPFIQIFDRLLGLILGLFEGVFILAIVLYFCAKYPLNDWLTFQMSQSFIAAILLKVAYVFMPLFPEAFKKIKSFI